jgi:hypothetical protein
MSDFSFEGDIKSELHLLGEMGYRGFADSPEAHLRIWYRGQAKKEWKLEPGVYRKTFPVTTEEERLHLKRKLTQDFRVESAGVLTSSGERR